MKSSLYDLCEMLDDELKEIVKKGDISPNELDRVYRAVDIIKDIKTIEAMEESQYSNARGGSNRGSYNSYDGSYDGSYEGGNSNARGGRGYSEDGSYRRGRDTMGRYTSRDGGYSREEDKDHMLKQIEHMKKQIENM